MLNWKLILQTGTSDFNSAWTKQQKQKLFKIALENSQVTYILNDGDVKRFYEKLIVDEVSEVANIIKEKLIDD